MVRVLVLVLVKIFFVFLLILAIYVTLFTLATHSIQYALINWFKFK